MIIQKILDFWDKYENLNLKIAFILIGLQIVHLAWLTTDVVVPRAFGTESLFPDFLVPLLILVDYVEIPGLIAGVTFYGVSLYRKQGTNWKNILLLSALVVQVLHIFWITDEFVVETFFESSVIAFPYYLAWIAILIDYLEVPVIFDLFRRVAKGKRK